MRWEGRLLRLGTGPRLLTRPGIATHDTRLPLSRRHLSVSLVCLSDLLQAALELGIRFYRLASQFVPVFCRDDLVAFREELQESASVLRWVAELMGREGVRLTAHPFLQVQLAAAEPQRREGALAAACAWAELLDSLELGPECRIVVHAADPQGFREGFSCLPAAVQGRLALENEPSGASLATLLALSLECGLPLVFDYQHYRCTGGEAQGLAEVLQAAWRTWRPGERPEVHFSTPRTNLEHGRAPSAVAHADFVDPFAFADFAAAVLPLGDCDVFLEARAKDLALLKLRADVARFSGGRIELG
jgi:UV DNA damage endonuclease